MNNANILYHINVKKRLLILENLTVKANKLDTYFTFAKKMCIHGIKAD